MTVEDTPALPRGLPDFEGVWRLEREVFDRLTGQTGRLDGEAVLSPVPGGLAYAETGVLRLPGAAPMRAERRYLWRAVADGIAVDFADGRAFHAFSLQTPTPRSDHFCAPDEYRVAYDFRAWPDWRAVWDVSGPRKRYRMVSEYRRV